MFQKNENMVLCGFFCLDEEKCEKTFGSSGQCVEGLDLSLRMGEGG
jgi:hypothetical protein